MICTENEKSDALLNVMGRRHLYEATALIGQYAEELTKAAVEAFGEVDLTAHELCVYITNIERVAERMKN